MFFAGIIKKRQKKQPETPRMKTQKEERCFIKKELKIKFVSYISNIKKGNFNNSILINNLWERGQ